MRPLTRRWGAPACTTGWLQRSAARTPTSTSACCLKTFRVVFAGVSRSSGPLRRKPACGCRPSSASRFPTPVTGSTRSAWVPSLDVSTSSVSTGAPACSSLSRTFRGGTGSLVGLRCCRLRSVVTLRLLPLTQSGSARWSSTPSSRSSLQRSTRSQTPVSAVQRRSCARSPATRTRLPRLPATSTSSVAVRTG